MHILHSALGSSVAAPGVEEAMVDFGNDSSILSALIVCIYNLGLAVGPVIVAMLRIKESVIMEIPVYIYLY